ncbi:hypothetical protein M408DRAFT_323343 [Serendipita vermifera MAFF 305830]|uniref:Autophagy-related protein n=1 Tax=Serendipita vermifera MAFF 305830 TaxID=933852 RepID=A0A0C3B1B4_SERVB|nr:hypothetical protein M408DRAFT_323343 [Serendipita vermifera MAFF 305830]
MTITRRIILSSAAAAIIMAGKVLSSSITNWQSDPSGPEDPDEMCGFEGNSDMYGLGIRVGIYLQSGSFIIAELINRRSVLDQLAFGNSVFQLALTIGLIYMTVTSPAFEAIEAAIIVLVNMCLFSGPHVTIPELEPSLHRPYTLSNVQEFVRYWGFWVYKFTVGYVLMGYSAWFWFAGLDKLARSPCTGFAFFFTRVDLYGWFRTLGKAYVVWELLLRTFGYSAWFAGLCKSDQNESSHGGQVDEEWIRREKGTFWIILPAFNRFTILVFSILSVELMIKWNQVAGVEDLASVGQLIAFLLGFGGIISVIVGEKVGDK